MKLWASENIRKSKGPQPQTNKPTVALVTFQNHCFSASYDFESVNLSKSILLHLDLLGRTVSVGTVPWVGYPSCRLTPSDLQAMACLELGYLSGTEKLCVSIHGGELIAR